ncbi:amidohydrolase family protein [Pantoea sp. KPR_PJ]|uniref:amidohydrolase family protein n=1 Tax=Pantoea sp. KPR_PJ TaxID=2738375 RepID=UPI003529D082
MPVTRRHFLQLSSAFAVAATFPTFASVPYSAGDTPPKLVPPSGSVDCHMHLYDSRYPSVPGTKFVNPPDASLDDYRKLQQRLGMNRMVIVTPSRYGTDNRILLNGLAASNGNARGVAVVDETVTDDELEQLHQAGVRGIRFNVIYSKFDPEEMTRLATRIHALNWHIQVVSSGEKLVELESRLQKLPTPVVIDHMGHVPQPEGIKSPTFAMLRRMLDGDKTWVKLSGAYIDSLTGAPGYQDVAPVAQSLVNINPERMLWGSDWPHPTQPDDKKPDDAVLLDLISLWAPDSRDQQKILRDNPVKLYGF